MSELLGKLCGETEGVEKWGERTGRCGGLSVCSSGGEDLGRDVVLPCRAADSGAARPVLERQVDTTALPCALSPRSVHPLLSS